MHLVPARVRPARRAVALVLAAALAVLLLPASASPARATDSVGPCGFYGSGTPGDPFQVGVPADLACLKDNSAYWGSDFMQSADLNMGDLPAWTHGIGSEAIHFTGSYSGGDHSITGLGLIIGDGFEGMFGYVDSAAIGSLNLGVSITKTADSSGMNWVGGVAGYMAGNSSMVGVHVTSAIATIGASAANAVGGAVGGMDDVAPSFLQDVHASTSITLNGLSSGTNDGVGGLVGYAFAGLIQDSTASGYISMQTAQATTNSNVNTMNVGGLVGSATNVTIGNVATDMQVTLQVTGSSGVRAHVDNVGGLVGSTSAGTITDATVAGDLGAYSTGYISGVGGLVGSSTDTPVTRARSRFNLVVTSAESSGFSVGGLVGRAGGGAFSRVSANASIQVTGPGTGEDIGGLMGGTRSEGTGFSLADAYAKGTIQQGGALHVGGLIGYATTGTVGRAYAQVNYTGSGPDGGLIGLNDAISPINLTATSFFDMDSAGTGTGSTGATSASIVPLHTAALHQYATFATGGTGPDGDFTAAWAIVDGFAAADGPNTWGICPGANLGVPFQLWEYPANPCIRWLTVDAPANGSIASDPAGVTCPAGDCSASFDWDTPVVLTATPDSGYYLSTWTGACTGTTATCDVQMDAHRTVGATFLPIQLPSITTAPSVTISTGAKLPTAALTSAVPVTVTWAASAGSSATTSYTLEISKNGGAYVFVKEVTAPATTTTTSVPSAGTFRFRVTAHSADGDSAALAGTSRTVRLVQQSATAVKYAGTWTAASSTAFSGGSLTWSKTARSTATLMFTGSQFALVADRATLRGKVSISVDGAKPVVVDLAGSTAHRYIAWRWSGVSKTHTVKVTVLATAGRPRIDLDAFVTLR